MPSKIKFKKSNFLKVPYMSIFYFIYLFQIYSFECFIFFQCTLTSAPCPATPPRWPSPSRTRPPPGTGTSRSRSRSAATRAGTQEFPFKSQLLLTFLCGYLSMYNFFVFLFFIFFFICRSQKRIKKEDV